MQFGSYILLTRFKEGLFCKCYHEDAMVYVNSAEKRKLSSKFIKSIGAELLSLGFRQAKHKKAFESGALKIISECLPQRKPDY